MSTPKCRFCFFPKIASVWGSSSSSLLHREKVFYVNFPSVLCSKQRCRDSLRSKRKILGRSDHSKKKIICCLYWFSGTFPLVLICLQKVLIPPAKCSSKFYVDGNNLNYIYGVFILSPFGHVFWFWSLLFTSNGFFRFIELFQVFLCGLFFVVFFFNTFWKCSWYLHSAL